MSPGLIYNIPERDPKPCEHMLEFAELLAHAMRAAHEGDHFAAGAWYRQAALARDKVKSRHFAKMAGWLLEGFVNGIAEVQEADRQDRVELARLRALQSVRAGVSGRATGLLRRLSPRGRGDDCHVLQGVPQGAGAHGA